MVSAQDIDYEKEISIPREMFDEGIKRLHKDIDSYTGGPVLHVRSDGTCYEYDSLVLYIEAMVKPYEDIFADITLAYARYYISNPKWYTNPTAILSDMKFSLTNLKLKARYIQKEKQQ
jgi:hypothetical protein